MCMESLEGPRPVYKKNGFPFSYLSRIPPRSLRIKPNVQRIYVPLTEEETSPEVSVRFSSSQLLKSIKNSLINFTRPKRLNQLVIINSTFICRDNFKWIDDLLRRFRGLLTINLRTSCRDLIQRHLRESRYRMLPCFGGHDSIFIP